jgi:uncharacterized protein (TIGR00730 family)
MKSVCVFTGAAVGNNRTYIEAAIALAEELAKRKINLVYGGGRNGLMGILADTVLKNGGNVTGVITHSLYEIEGHNKLTELHKIETMQERKLMMAQLADGFIALPGGLGTLEELFEIWNAAKIKIHAKPIGLLNTNNFYGKLLEMVAFIVKEGFATTTHQELLKIAGTPADLLSIMKEDNKTNDDIKSSQPFLTNFRR